MRVALAGLHAETNTFAPVAVDRATLDLLALRGEQIVAQLGESRETTTGFLRACAREEVEVTPLLYVNALACGVMRADAFEAVVDELVSLFHKKGPFDVILLAQHGAAVAENHPDADGELVAAVRHAVGPDVTIGVGLDLHGNVSPRLIEACDVAVGYRENPHRDPLVRAEECAYLTLRAARGQIRPVACLMQLPMVVPILGGWTGRGPMAELMEEAERIAHRHALPSHTVFHGFGYADVPQLGSSVLTLADGDPEVAEHAAAEIATALWGRREELRGSALSPEEAFSRVEGVPAGDAPVVLLDVGDNIGGGSPGDSTVLLAGALDREIEDFVIAICDEKAAAVAIAAGEGALVELEVGGTTSVSVGPRMCLAGRVTAVTDGRFEDGLSTHGGLTSFDGGPTVRVTTERRQQVIVSSRPVAPFSPEQLRAVGLDPAAQRAIVAKGVVAPRAGYEPVAGQFLLVETPGVTAADLSGFPYERRPTPLWPLEEQVEWRAAV